MSFIRRQLLFLAIFSFWVTSPCVAQNLDSFDEKVRKWAIECRSEVSAQFDLLLTSGQLSVPQLFDTFYIPIANTTPQKYRTQYDTLSDGVVRPIIDKYQKYNKRIRAVYIVDRNGYVPTHNSSFSRPLTGDADIDLKGNRTKRLFNDRTGLAAARNKKPYLLQDYNTDAGRSMIDMSVPITIQGRHWGAVRIVYKK